MIVQDQDSESLLEVTSVGPEVLSIVARRAARYQVRLEQGALEKLAQLLGPILESLGSPTVHLVSDTTVARLYLEPARAALTGLNVDVHAVVIDHGERAKSPETVERIWRALTAQRANRRSLLVALGGGVVCDVVGMAAALYMRGIPYVNVPTTLIAQADAAVGGKTGTDFEGTKNLVGVFNHPVGVFVDPSLLATLPRRQMSSGMAEVAKAGIVHDPVLCDILDREAGALLDARHPALPEVIMRAIQAKVDLLSADPYESGSLNRLLNLGHCFGHPLEAASGYRIPHGFAVARGIALATAIAFQRGLTSGEMYRRVTTMLTSLGLPLRVPTSLRAPSWAGVQDVRRIRNGQLRLVVPVVPGHCMVLPDVEKHEFLEAADALDALPGPVDVGEDA